MAATFGQKEGHALSQTIRARNGPDEMVITLGGAWTCLFVTDLEYGIQLRNQVEILGYSGIFPEIVIFPFKPLRRCKLKSRNNEQVFSRNFQHSMTFQLEFSNGNEKAEIITIVIGNIKSCLFQK